jgi:hypothetical protein
MLPVVTVRFKGSGLELELCGTRSPLRQPAAHFDWHDTQSSPS